MISQVVDRARRWGELAAAHGHDLPAVAVAFAALPAVVTRVVVGMASYSRDVCEMRPGDVVGRCVRDEPGAGGGAVAVLSGPLGSSRVLSGPLGSSRALSIVLGTLDPVAEQTLAWTRCQ